MDRLVRNIVQKVRSASMASIMRLDISPSPWNSTSRKRCEWQGRVHTHTHTYMHTTKHTGTLHVTAARPAQRKHPRPRLSSKSEKSRLQTTRSTQHATKNYTTVTKISIQELVRRGVLVPGHGVISARRKETEVAADLTSDAKFCHISVTHGIL